MSQSPWDKLDRAVAALPRKRPIDIIRCAVAHGFKGGMLRFVAMRYRDVASGPWAIQVKIRA